MQPSGPKVHIQPSPNSDRLRALGTRFWAGPRRVYLDSVPREPSRIHPDVKVAIERCVSGVWGWPLLLCGSTGIGKTSAALLLCDWVDGAGFQTASRFFDNWREIANDGRNPMTEKYGRPPLMVIDDLGIKTPTEFQRTALTELMTQRMAPTVVTSNLSLVELGQVFDGRVMDRLAGGTIVEAKGQSQRRMTDEEIAKLSGGSK